MRASGGELNHMDAARREHVKVVLEEAHKDLVKIRQRISDYQAFMTAENIETLNVWCRHEGSDIYYAGIDVRLSGRRLDFGYRVHGNRCTAKLVADEKMFGLLPPVTPFDKGDVYE